MNSFFFAKPREEIFLNSYVSVLYKNIRWSELDAFIRVGAGTLTNLENCVLNQMFKQFRGDVCDQKEFKLSRN